MVDLDPSVISWSRNDTIFHTTPSHTPQPHDSSQLDLLRLSTGSPSRVVTACTMLKRMLFRYQGHVSAALVLGGVDSSGAHLYQVGEIDALPAHSGLAWLSLLFISCVVPIGRECC